MSDLIDPRDLPALRALASRRVVLCADVVLPSGRLVSPGDVEPLCAGLEPLDAPGVTPGPAHVGEVPADACHR